MNREAIMAALFARLQTVSQFETTGRRVQFWSDVPAQPALFLRHVKDDYPPRPEGIPALVTMHAEAWIYSRAGEDPHAVPETALNQLVDAVEAALAPDVIVPNFSIENVQTLGGLVEHCWIEDEVLFDPGDIDKQAKAVIPIAMLVPQ